MVSSIFNICFCFLYFTELTWLQNKIENNPLHCCLDWYWCILLGYTRCCNVFFMVSNARGTGTWTNVKFPPTWDLIRVKCPGVARGGNGHSWIWLVHYSGTILWNSFPNSLDKLSRQVSLNLATGNYFSRRHGIHGKQALSNFNKFK